MKIESVTRILHAEKEMRDMEREEINIQGVRRAPMEEKTDTMAIAEITIETEATDMIETLIEEETTGEIDLTMQTGVIEIEREEIDSTTENRVTTETEGKEGEIDLTVAIATTLREEEVTSIEEVHETDLTAETEATETEKRDHLASLFLCPLPLLTLPSLATCLTMLCKKTCSNSSSRTPMSRCRTCASWSNATQAGRRGSATSNLLI